MNGTYVITEYEEKIMGFLLDEKKLVKIELSVLFIGEVNWNITSLKLIKAKVFNAHLVENNKNIVMDNSINNKICFIFLFFFIIFSFYFNTKILFK